LRGERLFILGPKVFRKKPKRKSLLGSSVPLEGMREKKAFLLGKTQREKKEKNTKEEGEDNLQGGGSASPELATGRF